MLLVASIWSCKSRPEQAPAGAASAAGATSAKVNAAAARKPGLDPGPIRPVSSQAPSESEPSPPPTFKTVGEMGETLEGQVHRFKLLAVHPCGPRPEKPVVPPKEGEYSTERIAVGAEVEIQAKGRLFISPRDVTLRSGGIFFYANLDLERRLEGCTPVLQRDWLDQDQSVRGFVLFDLPIRKLEGFELAYRPTRWGGAIPLRVPLRGCVTCRDDPPQTAPAEAKTP